MLFPIEPVFFFFKQKTAYEMRISDWSSDVCSSDLHALMGLAPRLLVLGGGGYNPWAVGRCWAGVWATLNGIDPTVAPTPGALAVLARQTWNRSQGRVPLARWLTTIADPPQHGDRKSAA